MSAMLRMAVYGMWRFEDLRCCISSMEQCLNRSPAVQQVVAANGQSLDSTAVSLASACIGKCIFLLLQHV
jgi:hypothetical protein